MPVKRRPQKRKANADAAHITARIKEYLAAQPAKARRRLGEMRRVIRAAAPDAVEYFSYRMPAFQPDGKVLVWYAGFKEHTSLFPIDDAMKRRFAAELRTYETSTGTVRFPLDRPLATGFLAPSAWPT